MKVFLPKGFHASKYEEIRKDDELWSTATAVQLEEARYRYDLEDCSEQRIVVEKMEEKRQFLHKLIEIKYHEDHMTRPCTLTAEQIENIFNLFLACDTFQELKCQVENKEIHKTVYKQHRSPFRVVGFILYVCKETVRIPFFTFLLVSYSRMTCMYFLHIEFFHITQHMYIGFSLA